MSLMGIMRRRSAIVFTSIFLLIVWFWNGAASRDDASVGRARVDDIRTGSNETFDGEWAFHRDQHNLRLDATQCDRAFPGLFEEIERPWKDRRLRRITLNELNSIEPRNGYVRAMIYDHQLYVIATDGKIYSRDIATLHSIHRAIVSSPEPLPNIEFAFNSDDRVDSVALWGYARRQKDTSIWLIPDFSYWSWPETKVGTMREVQMKAEELEESGTWSWKDKVPKLLWRGVVKDLEVRKQLLEVTHRQSWADVKAIDWKDQKSMKKDLMSMSDHCQYKYLAHAEGDTYSGRLKYLQSCKSVIIAHQMDWIQHHHPLMRSTGPDQNYVEVRRDFGDLPDRIEWLQEHDDEAERIATNNVNIFRKRFLTPAAEVCYWRRLIHRWGEVSFEPSFFKEVDGNKKVWRGVPVESFLLEKRLDWDPY